MAIESIRDYNHICRSELYDQKEQHIPSMRAFEDDGETKKSFVLGFAES